MPGRCCVPFCKGNYPNGPHVSVFTFPKDLERRDKWLTAIQRKDFYPSKSSRVCELHFKAADFETEVSAYDEKTGRVISVPLKVRRLKNTSIPSIFKNYPPSSSKKLTSSRKDPEIRKQEKEMMQLKEAIAASVESSDKYNESRKISSVQDIVKCLEKYPVSNFWTIYKTECLETLCILHIETEPEPFIQYAIKIDQNLQLTFSIEKQPAPKFLNVSFPILVNNFNDITNLLDIIETNYKECEETSKKKSVITLICNLLDSISSEEHENIIKFIKEQLNLLLNQSNNFRYSSEFLVFSCILKTISPHAYKFLRQSGNLTMPHPDTLSKLCKNLNISPHLELLDENFLMYIKNRINYIEEHEKTVTLLLDEIHIKPYFDYKGGAIVGAAFDSSKAATSAFVFMVSSVLSSFKEVVHILPVSSINFKELHNVIEKVIIGLENIGLKVICIVTDNNSINGKAMSLFTEPPKRSYVYPHPLDKSRPLFFLIDSVHLFKNIRNNWLNQKNPGLCFFYPDFENPCNEQFKTASFLSLRKLHEIESNKIVKYATGLTLKSLAPSSLERQNVKLVLKVFNKFVIQGLLTLGPIHEISHFEETSSFISIICCWWDIFNVKTSTKGIHQRNVFMEPLNANEMDKKSIFINKFLDWLEAWEGMKCTTGAFSKETHSALRQTSQGMLELARYCINECKMKYILPGKIQTDCLEARFGKYRQMAGSQYHISMRQLLECEKKLRLQSCVKLELLIKNQIVSINDFNDEGVLNMSPIENMELPEINLEDSELESSNDYLPVLTYLGGYCSYTVNKKLKCDFCKEHLVVDSECNLDEKYNLIKALDKGGLKCPTQIVVTAVLLNYHAVNKLYTNSENFMKQNCQKNIIVEATLKLLKERKIILDECPFGHVSENIFKLLLCVSTNIMLKNLCNTKNDLLNKKTEKNVSKKRKLETLK